MFKDREVIAEECYQVPVVLETCSGGYWGPYRCRKSINLICIWLILIYRHHLIHNKSTIGAEFGLLDERIDVCVPGNRVRSDRFNHSCWHYQHHQDLIPSAIITNHGLYQNRCTSLCRCAHLPEWQVYSPILVSNIAYQSTCGWSAWVIGHAGH